jgi:hypothetical protein
VVFKNFYFSLPINIPELIHPKQYVIFKIITPFRVSLPYTSQFLKNFLVLSFIAFQLDYLVTFLARKLLSNPEMYNFKIILNKNKSFLKSTYLLLSQLSLHNLKYFPIPSSLHLRQLLDESHCSFDHSCYDLV